MFNEYPYVNLQDVNLDWILKHIKELETNLKDFVKLNTIKYADPIIWNITKQYETNTVVIDGNTGTAYLSVQPVPAGVALTNDDYWTVIFTLNLTTSNQNITFRDDGTNVVATFASDTGDWILWNFYLYRVTQPISVNTAYLEGFNLERFSVELFIRDYINTLTAIIGDLDDLTTTDKTSIVNAINNVLSNTIGDLNNLDTSVKTSIVDSINSLKTDIETKIGNLTDLTTTDKDSIVESINSVQAELDTVIVDYAKYGITGDGVETAKFDALLADLESGHHYIFPYTEVKVLFQDTARLVALSDIIIDGLNLNGTINYADRLSDDGDYTGAGLQFSGNNIKIVNCQFKNIHQCLLIGSVNGIIIDNCNFKRCGYSVLQMRNITSNNGVVSNCRFEDNTRDAIELNCDSGGKSYNWIIKGNICTGYTNFPNAAPNGDQRFCGVTNVEHVIISDNVSYNINGDAHVHIENDAEDIIISNNYFGEFVGIAAILILANTALSQPKRKVLIVGNHFNSSADDGNYRKFIQANSTINDVTIRDCTFYTTLDNTKMGILSGDINNYFINCYFDMANYGADIPRSQFCKYIVKGQNDLVFGHYISNSFTTSLIPSIKRTTTAGVARPWSYSTFLNNVANHSLQINDAFHSVIKNNYVSTEGETNDFSGINIYPPTTSTIKDNYIAGL